MQMRSHGDAPDNALDLNHVEVGLCGQKWPHPNGSIGRGGEIRTHDPLRPRHRNTRLMKLRKSRIFNALAVHHLQSKSGNVVEFVAVDPSVLNSLQELATVRSPKY